MKDKKLAETGIESSGSSSDDEDEEMDEEDVIINKLFTGGRYFTARTSIVVPMNKTYINVIQLSFSNLKEMSMYFRNEFKLMMSWIQPVVI